MAIHFQLDGNIIHVDSEEAKIQLGLLDPTFITEDKIDEVEEEQEGSQAPALVQRSAEPSVIKLVNQFNFCEHASQTYNNASKDFGNQTEPPARSNFSGNITQWGVYDFYQSGTANKVLILLYLNLKTGNFGRYKTLIGTAEQNQVFQQTADIRFKC